MALVLIKYIRQENQCSLLLCLPVFICFSFPRRAASSPPESTLTTFSLHVIFYPIPPLPFPLAATSVPLIAVSGLMLSLEGPSNATQVGISTAFEWNIGFSNFPHAETSEGRKQKQEQQSSARQLSHCGPQSHHSHKEGNSSALGSGDTKLRAGHAKSLPCPSPITFPASRMSLKQNVLLFTFWMFGPGFRERRAQIL